MRKSRLANPNSPAIVSVLAASLVWGATVRPVLAQTPAPADAAKASAPAASAPAAAAKTSAPAASAKASGAEVAAAPAVGDGEPTQEQKDLARSEYTLGQTAFQSGNYPAAEQHFSKANATLPSPHAQYWMAMSADMQGKTPEAVAALEVFLATPGNAAVGEDKVTTAQQRLEALKKIPGTLALTVVPGDAKITVDGAAQFGQSPFSVKLPAGAHKVVIAAPGYTATEVDLNVKPGENQEKLVTLSQSTEAVVAAPVDQGPPAPPPEPPSKVPAYVTLGIAGASAVAGTVFGILALTAKSDYDNAPTSDKADEVERNALIADMAWGVTITLGITGIVLLTSDDGGDEAVAQEQAGGRRVAKAQAPRRVQTQLNVAPYFSKEGGGAAARLTF